MMEPKKLSTTAKIPSPEISLTTLPYEAYEVLRAHELELVTGFVTWKAGNPNHPRNWPTKRKIYDTSVVILLQLVTLVLTCLCAWLSNRNLFHVALSYLLGQVVGALLFPPFSETFGRKSVYAGSTLLYAIFSALAAITDFRAICIGRFLSGVSSAVPAVVAAGSIQDMWEVSDRIWAVFAWQAMGIIGLAIGPIIATFLTDSTLGWYAFYFWTLAE
ncbi:MAG: hypothetical protein Q9219_001829 [cf. Caloplaca sp. 3 TL-2023]